MQILSVKIYTDRSFFAKLHSGPLPSQTPNASPGIIGGVLSIEVFILSLVKSRYIFSLV